MESFEVAGREHVSLTTDQLRVEVVPALGGTICSLIATPSACPSGPAPGDPETGPAGTELLWQPPWGIRPAGAVALPGSVVNTATDTFPGGWLTLFPNGSESTVVDGADWPAWGEARLAHCAWRSTAGSIILTSRLLRSPFEITKIISVRDGDIEISETVQNVGEQHLDVVWGSQLIFGGPMLGPQTRFDSRASLVRPDARQTPSADYEDILSWPRSYTSDGLVNLRSLPDLDRRVSRTAYLSDFSSPDASLTNTELGIRVALNWDGDLWPYLWYQLETGGRSGYPWWGAARYLALTPATSWPAAGLAEIRRVSATSLRIHPGSSRTSQLSVRVGPS